MNFRSSLPRITCALVLILLLLSACQQETPTPLSETIVDLTPTLATTEWVVGEQRIVFGLLDREQRLVSGAEVILQFFYLEGGAEELQGSAEVTPLDLGLPAETLSEPVPALYFASFHFDQSGLWGIEFQAAHPDYQPSVSRRQVLVVVEPPTPGVGDAAIPSQNPVFREGEDISTVTSDPHPDPDLYQITIARAIQSGKPTVVNFSTPAFCTSRTCGPALEVVKAVQNAYTGQANFIHVEIYDDRPPDVAAAVQEWGLRSEPWTFVIDAQGIITARFESLVGYNELEQALLAVLDD